ncbi:hypothetical protein A3D78_06575 [Candidatus Gottesmanbacteria bacterium RIFCSPHIGHO2_02_FULL_39_14]|uniref:Cation-transporting P-type ATPase N-terminal domain-containing protein n=2 Tax=Candidatus Gottesmaniibacteriota TaxID=1752720 RepID=A0A1F5ZX41_9BACT|nr:MAG: hypothetical protein A3D78_06575 [Candidatus Gottesmanbacteria bacterium RIFCSPHIGHO2_02_FULL_39_14]OGG31382.1 MAG: hypothetical protein A3I51_03025 [Candidatus Gottesmanbacteria bacterium RIFCSPLOWO2_02_FULL_38_8]
MYYQKSVQETVRELSADVNHGLSKREVGIRLLKYGPNALPAKPKPPAILHFINQFKNLLVIILLLASLVSLFIGDIVDSLAIFAIVALNATIGTIQEVKAEKTLESLKEKEILYTLILRDNKVQKVPAGEIVIGDVLILEEGEKIPADARLVEEFSLIVDESILTGESLPVTKNIDPILKTAPLADQLNMIFKDTKIVSGRGKAIVIGTGLNTEIGRIAASLHQTKSEKTPLTLELEKVSWTLTAIIGIIAAIIFALNLLHDIHLVESLLVSISLSVAAIPEGLPAIVTIVLSIGVKRLADKKTIIKKLPSVETLGAVRIIATDKTGTLTQNVINVVNIVLPQNKLIRIQGNGYQLTGTFYNEMNKRYHPKDDGSLNELLTSAVLANNATLEEKYKQPKVLGDTTEAALLVAGYRAGLNVKQILAHNKRVFEKPFTSLRKMMSVVVRSKNNYLLYAKGAPEIILNCCLLSPKEKRKILATNVELAKKGLRSLVIAKKQISESQVKRAIKTDIIEENKLTYLGIVAMQDPLRPEIVKAIREAKLAGIRTVMITGDHSQTAATIAQQAGILSENNRILTQLEVDKLTVSQLAGLIKKGVNIFARISPLGKLKIVTAIKKIANTQVAVTGDGVNDAPALKAAHIGIAMGRTGTDLTREVADMVITDDNYATIIDAVREGRIIFANLVKFIRYLISCNLSEVLVVTAAVLMSTPLPLLPIQILWVNLVTDGFPALALGMEPPERDVMKNPPRDLALGILHRKRWAYMVIEGSIIGLSVFLLFLFALKHFNYREAQTMTFTTLAFAQLVHAFNNRSTRKSIFDLGLFSNIYLVWGVVISILLQILVVQTHWGNLIFKTAKLAPFGWLYIVLFSLIPLIAVEIKKQLRFRILP